MSPLGDPPLFVGFLRGVDFFWTTTHLAYATAIVAMLVLAIFLALDVWFARGEPKVAPAVAEPLRLRGLINLPLIAFIIGAILLSATWKPGIEFDVYGTHVALQNLVRDGALIVIALASLWLTPEEHREANDFTWEPIAEVAKLFAGIFVCIIPVLAMLEAGHDGPFAWLLTAVTAQDGSPHEVAYFWLTGLLSAFLDNAPTYLVFFQLAGGDAAELMSKLAPTLAAISMGAVYMGALTYIGNAPNFMVAAIANERGVKMPSFFGYMLWSFAVLLPVLGLLTFFPSARLDLRLAALRSGRFCRLRRQHRDRLDLEQPAGPRQRRHADGRRSRRRLRIEIAVAHLAEGAHIGLDIDEIIVDLDHVAPARARSHERQRHVLERLHTLRAEIAGRADELVVGIHPKLAGKINGAVRPGRLDDVAVARRLGERCRIAEADIGRHIVLPLSRAHDVNRKPVPLFGTMRCAHYSGAVRIYVAGAHVDRGLCMAERARPFGGTRP